MEVSTDYVGGVNAYLATSFRNLYLFVKLMIQIIVILMQDIVENVLDFK